MPGRYAFSIPETVVKGELRPFRDPAYAQLSETLDSLFRCVAPRTPKTRNLPDLLQRLSYQPGRQDADHAARACQGQARTGRHHLFV